MKMKSILNFLTSKSLIFLHSRNAKEAKEYFDKTYIDTCKLLHRIINLHSNIAQIAVEYARTINDPSLPKAWSRHAKMNNEVEIKRKKPNSQIEAEDRKEIENKKKKFKEFVAVMMAKGSKTKSKSWNESFNDFVPKDITKSRRQRKKEELELKQQKQAEKQSESQNELKILNEKVIESQEGVTIVEKEINKRSTKLGKSTAKQVHIKFGENANIDAAIEKIEENTQIDENKQNQENYNSNDDEGEMIDENRLYVMNLPFEITDMDLREYFGTYGEIDEISIPLRAGGIGTGFGFVRFIEPESAINAYANLDKKIFQGRILTILPASKKKESLNKANNLIPEEDKSQNKNDKYETEKSSFKKEKKTSIKRNFDDETNWNYLFMNKDAVIESAANKLAVRKGEILNKDDDNLAVRVTNIETQIIKETKEWLMKNGIDIKAIEGKDNRLS